MRLIKRLLGCLVILAFFCVFGEVFAEEGMLNKAGVEASGTLDYYSKYVWRGFLLDSDSVIQYGFDLSKYGLTLSFWGSQDVENDDALDSDELDYIVDYTKEFENVSLSLGHTYYDFPETDTTSKEFYIGTTLPNMLLGPTLAYYHDYGDESDGGGDGDYIVLEVSHSFGLAEDSSASFDLGGHVGYNDGLFINGEGGDYLVSVGFTIPLTENLSFVPNANYSIPFGDVEDVDDGNQDDEFYGGFSLGYDF